MSAKIDDESFYTNVRLKHVHTINKDKILLNDHSDINRVDHRYC